MKIVKPKEFKSNLVEVRPGLWLKPGQTEEDYNKRLKKLKEKLKGYPILDLREDPTPILALMI